MKKHTNATRPTQQKLVLSAIAAGVLMICGAQASASVTSPTIGRLLWSEEFNGTSLDTTRWTADNGNGCQINLCGYGNAELQYYSPNFGTTAGIAIRLAFTCRRSTLTFSAFGRHWGWRRAVVCWCRYAAKAWI